ncbi:MAG: hypothetical protein AAB116_17065 [Candidatus Poribacteria bacterium]
MLFFSKINLKIRIIGTCLGVFIFSLNPTYSKASCIDAYKKRIEQMLGWTDGLAAMSMPLSPTVVAAPVLIPMAFLIVKKTHKYQTFIHILEQISSNQLGQELNEFYGKVLKNKTIKKAIKDKNINLTIDDIADVLRNADDNNFFCESGTERNPNFSDRRVYSYKKALKWTINEIIRANNLD